MPNESEPQADGAGASLAGTDRPAGEAQEPALRGDPRGIDAPAPPDGPAAQADLADQPARRPLPLRAQFVDLLLVQLSNWRWSWPQMVITGMVTPLLGVLALGVFARNLGPDVLGYVLTGNVVLALLFESQNKVASNFTFLRLTGALDFFASLPVRRWVLVLASLAAFLLLALPALTVTAVVGSVLLGLPLHPSPLLLVVVPCAVTPFAGLGAWIGVLARAPEESSSVSLVASVLMTAVGPVVVAPGLLPGWLVGLGWLNPATWAASALRQVLLGPVTPWLLADLAVLAFAAALVLWLVGRRMRWRAE
jgi:ABC-2 type transport system permease protein